MSSNHDDFGSQNYKDALNRLLQMPPDFEALNDITFTPEELSLLAFNYAFESWGEAFIEYKDFTEAGYLSWCNSDPDLIPGLHSTYLYEVIEYLLEKGLDPNGRDPEGYPFMLEISHVVNGYVAADTLRLLLEHGGDPNVELPDGTTLYSEIDFDIIFDALEQDDRRRYDSLVHCWLVLLGFGGKHAGKTEGVDLYDVWNPDLGYLPFHPEDFREHRNYIFGLTRIVNRGQSPTIHIFDKRTYWEVARL